MEGLRLSYEDMHKFASALSDHGSHVDEFEPAILEGLKTPPENAFLEIGNREGGSMALTLWHLGKENKKRVMVGVDWMHDSSPWWATYFVNIPSKVAMLDIPFVQYLLDQTEFSEKYAKHWSFGYILHDGNHLAWKVIRDVTALSKSMCKGGVIAIDDINDSGLGDHDFSDCGLERIWLKTSDVQGHIGDKSKHIGFWRKI